MFGYRYFHLSVLGASMVGIWMHKFTNLTQVVGRSIIRTGCYCANERRDIPYFTIYLLCVVYTTIFKIL